MEVLVEVHSLGRWAVLLTAIAALAVAALALRGRREWDVVSDRTMLAYVVVMDVQVLIGLVLWLLGGRWAGDLYLGWLHPAAMLAAAALAHVARRRSDAAGSSQERGRAAALLTGASLIVILVAIPVDSWPI